MVRGYQLEIPWDVPGGGYKERTIRGSAQPSKVARGGHLRVWRRTSGIKSSIETLHNQTAGASKEIEQRAKDFSDTLKSVLKIETQRAYVRGTGRFSRGINTRVKVKRGSGRQPTTAIVEVMVPNYRESRFLTNIGNQGRFKSFPVEDYWIFARGARDLLVTHQLTDEPMTKKQVRSLKARIARRKRVGRLKVPLSQIGLISRALPGRRRETELFPGVPLEPGLSPSSQFVYPLEVHHPGFPRDVVSEVTFALGGQYTEGMIFGMRDVFVSKRIPFTEATVQKAGEEPGVVMGSTKSDRYVEILMRSTPNPYAAISARRRG